MFTKVDKAWAGAFVSFVALTANQFFGIVIDPVIQAGLIAGIVWGAVYLTKNKVA